MVHSMPEPFGDYPNGAGCWYRYLLLALWAGCAWFGLHIYAQPHKLDLPCPTGAQGDRVSKARFRMNLLKTGFLVFLAYFAEIGITWAAQQLPGGGGGVGGLPSTGLRGATGMWDPYSGYRETLGAAGGGQGGVGAGGGYGGGAGRGDSPSPASAASAGAGTVGAQHHQSRYLLQLERDLATASTGGEAPPEDTLEVPGWLSGWNMLQYRSPSSRWPQFLKNHGPAGEDHYVYAREAIGDPGSPGNMQRQYYWAFMASRGCGGGFVLRSMGYPDRYLRMDPDGTTHIEQLRNSDNAFGPLCWDVEPCAESEQLGLFSLHNRGSDPKRAGHYLKVDVNRPVMSTPFHEEASCVSLVAYKTGGQTKLSPEAELYRK